MSTRFHRGLMWFRRDLRVDDNHALSQALSHCEQVFCAFVFDQDILSELPREDRRVEFIRESLVDLDAQIRALSGVAAAGLICVLGSARSALPELARELGVQAVFANEDYEPDAIGRDAHVRAQLGDLGVATYLFKDQVIFAPRELQTAQARPYAVYTPFRRAWLAKLEARQLAPYAITNPRGLVGRPPGMLGPVPGLAEIGFVRTNLSALDLPPGAAGALRSLEGFLGRIDAYQNARDFPAVRGPSYLSVHLRFGTVSVRRLFREACARADAGSAGARCWRDELIWREFYFQVLGGFPHLYDAAGRARCFKPEFDALRWETGARAEALFYAWACGQTGFPLVDAGMRQLLKTGYMHNRLRMVTASFLTKDLGVDWRLGERFFARHLNDYELASNNGGWQWAASTGCDAQPWFRIFNPTTQSEKFDPDGKFIARYVPELARLAPRVRHAPWRADPIELAAAGVELGASYPRPIVDHGEARERTLTRFGALKLKDAGD